MDKSVVEAINQIKKHFKKKIRNDKGRNDYGIKLFN